MNGSQYRARLPPDQRHLDDFPSTHVGFGEPVGMQNGHGPISITPGQDKHVSGHGAGFLAARSPPKKSTSHVPCKFFPTGQCQAGPACQFSHDLDPVTQHAPCKYFARGSCKFGQTCALMHIMPDGRIMNRPGRNSGGAYGRRSAHNGPMYSGGQAAPLAINTHEQGQPFQDHIGYHHPDPRSAYIPHPTSPIFQTELSHSNRSNLSSPCGSPTADVQYARSPPRQGLTARDAPLPPSFDSRGVSQIARNGPFAASVPGRFAFESPPASFPKKAQLGNGTLGDMRNSAFGDAAGLDGMLHGLGSSPRDNETLTFDKRPLHSERFARYRPTMSSSLDLRPSFFPQASVAHSESDLSSDDDAGEDLLPHVLRDLLPTNKTRRASRNGNGLPDDDLGTSWTSGPRRTISFGPYTETTTGSLSPHSASPSRYTGLWAARSASNTKLNEESSQGAAFGHVGSPLRPSNLRASCSTAAPSTNGTGLSMLTSQLQHAKLTDTTPISSPGMATEGSSGTSETTKNTSDHSPHLRQQPNTADRPSSSAINKERIDEEAMFSMDGDETNREELAETQVQIAPLPLTNGAGAAIVARPTWSMVAGGKSAGAGAVGRKAR